jgi:hypothetical protein
MPTECNAKPLEFAPVAARRPELERVLDELEAGDALVVTKLDRLACSTLDLLRMVDKVWLQEPWPTMGRHHDVGRPAHAEAAVLLAAAGTVATIPGST